jgi:hypothetical protein
VALFQILVEAGIYGWVIAFLGSIGLIVGLVASAKSAAGQRAAFVLGLVAMLMATLVASVAVLGNWSERRKIDALYADEALGMPAAERLQRHGYKKAQSISTCGLVFAFLPLMCGAIAAFRGRRRSEAPLGGVHAPPEASVQFDGGAQVLVAGLVFGVGAVAYLGAALPLVVPLPGRDWPLRDPRWAVADATYTVMQRRKGLDEHCNSLEHSLDELQRQRRPEPDASEVPDLRTAAGRCVDERIRNIETNPKASGRRAALEELAKSSLVLDDEHRNKVREAADGVGPDEPPANAVGSAKGDGDSGAAAATGRLSPELIARVVRQNFSHMRSCYEKGLKKNPNLEGKIMVRFVIAADGTVPVAGSKETDLPDPEVVRCVVRAVKSLVFPQPEGGFVEVKYPIVFNASR